MIPAYSENIEIPERNESNVDHINNDATRLLFNEVKQLKTTVGFLTRENSRLKSEVHDLSAKMMALSTNSKGMW